MVIDNDWDQIFENSDSTSCPITECYVIEQGCPDDSPGVSGVSFHGLDLVAQADFEDGISNTVCIKCTNTDGYVYATHDGYVITQNHKCACSFSEPEDHSDVTLTHGQILNEILPSQSFVDWDSFFSNKYTEDCPITGCTLHLADDCLGE